MATQRGYVAIPVALVVPMDEAMLQTEAIIAEAAAAAGGTLVGEPRYLSWAEMEAHPFGIPIAVDDGEHELAFVVAEMTREAEADDLGHPEQAWEEHTL